MVRSAPVAPTTPRVPLLPPRPSCRTIQPILFGWDSSHSLYAVIARPGGDIGVRIDRRGGAPLTLCLLSPSIRFPFPSRTYRSIVRTCASRLFLPFPFHRLKLFIAHAPSLFLSPFLFCVTRSLFSLDPSEYGEIRDARFMDSGDLRNSAVEELPISDMRVSAYTLASVTRLGIYAFV